MDVIVKENIEQTTIIESMTEEKKTILEKYDHDNKIAFLKITTQNSEIIQLKQKLKELEKKISEKNNNFFQKIEKEEKLTSTMKEDTINYLELHNKFNFNDNLKDKMPIVQNCWVSETTLAEKIKIINKQSKGEKKTCYRFNQNKESSKNIG